MGTKRKFKRDYIILEAKDANFRYKERVLPKAFAKVEVNDDKSAVALYIENLKHMKDGYKVVAIQSDYETLDLGKVVLNEQGRGEFVLNLDDDNVDIKGIAILYEKTVPLIGFKGSKIDNYEEILFMGEDEPEDEYEEYEEIEYIEVEDGEEYEDDEYEEIEYIEVDEDYDDSYDDELNEVYEEVEDEVEEAQPQTKKNPSYLRDEEDLVLKKSKSNSLGNEQLNREKAKQVQYKPKKEYTRHQAAQQSNQQLNEENMHHGSINHKSNQYNYQANIESKKSAGALLMPRQIKKGLKYFREVKPFVEDYIEDTRWWKIEINPTTLCGYTMPYLGYVNSLNYTMYSDAIMNSYKYRHYLFGVQYDEYNKRRNYIYAIPGNNKEQPDKGHTGFTVYQPCDNGNNSLGYWLCFIDSRTRTIIK